MNDNKPRVFVVQRTQHNLSGALEHGELVFLLPEGSNISFSPQPLVRRLREALSDFDPDKDMLLPVGDPAAIGIACAVVAARTGGLIRLVKFDRVSKRYYVVRLDVFDQHPEPDRALSAAGG